MDRSTASADSSAGVRQAPGKIPITPCDRFHGGLPAMADPVAATGDQSDVHYS